MTDLESDLVFIIPLEAVFPTCDGVELHSVSHRVAVGRPHQYGGVRRPRQQGHPTDVTPAVLEGTQPGVLVLNYLPHGTTLGLVEI